MALRTADKLLRSPVDRRRAGVSGGYGALLQMGLGNVLHMWVVSNSYNLTDWDPQKGLRNMALPKSCVVPSS